MGISGNVENGIQKCGESFWLGAWGFIAVYHDHLQVSRDSPHATNPTNATGWTGPSQDRPDAGGSLASGEILLWPALQPWHLRAVWS